VTQEKTEKPSQKRLRDARKRGEVPKSAHLAQAMAFGVMGIALLVGAPIAWRWCRDAFRLIGGVAAASDTNGRLKPAMEWLLSSFMVAALVLCAVAAIAAAGAVMLQVRGVFSVHPIKPDVQRLNPGSNLKNLFSVKQLVELLKSLLEMVVMGCVAWLLIRGMVPEVLAAQQGDLGTLAALAARLLMALFFAAFLVVLCTGAVDIGLQHHAFIKKQRMSRQELRNEHKDAEGDPHIRAHRRRLHRAMAQAPLKQQVERASVVVVNPTHLAVGIRYEPGETDVPRVVVKGMDELAGRIRSLADELNVPVVRSPALARALYARSEEEEAVAPEFFDAVAAVLAAVQRLEHVRE
jgi:type III secretion YscU/HrpY family protein